jgi:hypothetical protein
LHKHLQVASTAFTVMVEMQNDLSLTQRKNNTVTSIIGYIDCRSVSSAALVRWSSRFLSEFFFSHFGAMTAVHKSSTRERQKAMIRYEELDMQDLAYLLMLSIKRRGSSPAIDRSSDMIQTANLARGKVGDR